MENEPYSLAHIAQTFNLDGMHLRKSVNDFALFTATVSVLLTCLFVNADKLLGKVARDST